MENENVSNESTEVTDQSNEIPGANPGETAAQTMARMFKVKVDGNEVEVDEAELLRGYAHNKAAEQRMREAGMTRKEAKAVIRLAQTDQRQFFKQLGIDPRQVAEKLIQEELSEAMLSPQEKEMRKIRQQLEHYQNSEKQAREEYEREVHEREVMRAKEEFESQFIEALKLSGHQATEHTVSRLAYYMNAALNAGYDVTPMDVLPYAMNEFKTSTKSYLNGLDDSALAEILGEDTIRRLLKPKTPVVKTNIVPKSVNSNRESKKEEKKHESPAEFFSKFRGR